MSTITTRSGKGSPLTNNEVDANFTNLNTDKLESADLAGYATLSGATFTGEVEATGFNGDLTGAILFKGQAGEGLTKGDPVYISGISGNKTVVSKADANDASKMPCFGIVDATVSANADCSVVTFGTLQGLDTSSFSEGNELFISDTGTLTTTAPTGEASQIQKIAKVTRSHASTGSIKVMGAGRTNAAPNLNDGKFFLGNGSNQAVSTDFASSVTAAGALMDSEVTNLAQVKAFDSADYATAAQGTKVDGIEAGADVTDTANVTAAGAVMDSELTSEASVKALNQGLATTDSPAFAGLTVDTTTLAVDSTNNRVGIGTASPSQALTVSGTDARIYLTGANTDIAMDNSANGQLSLDGNAYGFGIALNADGAQLYTNSVSRDLIFGVNETEVARLTPDNFTVTAPTDPTITVKATAAGDADADIILDANDTGESGVIFNNSGVKKARIDWSNQNLQLNMATESGTNGTIDFQPNDVLAMRITAAGVAEFKAGITEDSVTLSGTSTTIDLATATNFVHDLSGNTTYTFSNPATSGNASAFTLKIIQGSTARTITWPASVDWAGGTAPTLTATNNGVDIFTFFTLDGGTTYYGFTAGQAMA